MNIAKTNGIKIKPLGMVKKPKPRLKLPREAIIQEYLGGKTLLQVAIKYKVNENTIAKRLKEWGIPRRKPKGITKNLPKEEILNLVKAGNTQTAIASRYGVSTALIQTRLKQWGMPKMKQGPKRQIYIKKEPLLRLYNQGLSYDKMAEYFKVSAASIRNALVEHGIPLRGRGRRKRR